VRAFNPWPVAETVFADETLRIHDAYASDGEAVPTVAPGTWLGLAGEALRVACGVGELHVTQLQRAGRKVVGAREFVNSAGAAAGRFT
jgi:methionyl-tRNA formyltransferase